MVGPLKYTNWAENLSQAETEKQKEDSKLAVTRNLKLRLSTELTTDARYNLERIDQAFGTLPLSSGADQTIKSSGDIVLDTNSSSLGGNGSGTVYTANLNLTGTLALESGSGTLTLVAPSLSSDLTLTLPSNTGEAGQFLSSDGTGTTSWVDAPTTNFFSLNDTSFSGLIAGQVAQYDGSNWVNVTLPNVRQAQTFVWEPSDGATKTIIHNFNSSTITVWIYDTETNSEVWIEGIDYQDSDTILLSAHRAPSANYIVHLTQT